MAAGVFMFRYMVVSFMPAFGLSQAVTALVGRYIGMGRHDLAAARAHLGFVVTAMYMVCCGIVFFIWRRELIGVFRPTDAVLAMGMTLMVFAAIYQFFDAMYIIYNGALRGAGDTAIPALVTAGLCWGITVVGGWIVAHRFSRLGVAGPWTCATVYGIILGIWMFRRFRRGTWKRIRLEDDAPIANDKLVPATT
jgi:MATE family multidrug resistance protein